MKNKNLTFGLEFETDCFYFVTNNVNLRSYLSLDSIVTNSCLETSNFYKIDSNILDDFLLLSKKVIYTDHNLPLNQLNIYKIVLEIDITSIDLNALIYNNNDIILTNLNQMHSFSLDNILIFGTIPFQFVRKIIFMNLEEQNRFNYSFENINYPTHLYDINENIFFNQKYIDTTLLKESVKQYINRNSINIYQINEIVQKRNKIKAIINASLFNYSYVISGLELNFDLTTLDLLDVDKKDRLRLVKRMNELSLEHPFREKKKSNFLKEQSADNILRDLFIILDSLNQNDRTNQSYMQSFSPDAILFYETISILISINYLESLDSKNFISYLISKLNSYDDNVIKSYIKDINNLIVEVLNDNLSIKKVLSNNEIKSNIVIALMLFLKSSNFNESRELSKNLTAYGVSNYIRRIVFIFYNALNGYGVISGENKYDPYINRACDNITFRFTKSKYLISRKINDDKYLIYNPKNDITFYTSTHIPLRYKLYLSEIEVSSEKARMKLIKVIEKDPHITNKVLKLIPKDNYRVRNLLPIKLSIDKKYINTLNNDENHLDLTVVNQSFIKTEFDTAKFTQIVFDNQKCFFDLYSCDPEIWEAIINRI